ncbi:MAG TPA: peptidylprolyl isomerase [Polyangiales bacterium]|nr:peptidylprolyl isomerase [Polyangiales bacterium]
MDLANLVPTRSLMLRTLLHFFLIGGLLFGAKVVFQSDRQAGPEITVRVRSNATAGEIENEIREAILINEARRYGWDRSDPIVFDHLVRNMRFIEPESTDDDLTLYLRALEMDMHEHDPIVRARVLYRAREALGSIPKDRMPSREDLEAHLEAHRDRFEREGRVRMQHVFLSRSKRGEELSADAREMREKLSELGAEAPRGLGDPLPGLRAEQLVRASEVRDDYGEELGRVVEEGIVGPWRGPISSVYGLHFVRVLSKRPAYVPSLDVIAAEVRADRLQEIREELREERMAALRDAYTVHLMRSP